VCGGRPASGGPRPEPMSTTTTTTTTTSTTPAGAVSERLVMADRAAGLALLPRRLQGVRDITHPLDRGVRDITQLLDQGVRDITHLLDQGVRDITHPLDQGVRDITQLLGRGPATLLTILTQSGVRPASAVDNKKSKIPTNMKLDHIMIK